MDHKQHQQPYKTCRKHQIINKDYIAVEQAKERAGKGVPIEGGCYLFSTLN